MNSFVANFPVFLSLNSQAANESTPRLSTNKGTNPCPSAGHDTIHLNRPFTDTAAILNSLDLRSIMGCPGGTRSVFTRAFRAKRELHCIFLGKKAIIVTPKHGNDLFFSLQSFYRKT